MQIRPQQTAYVVYVIPNPSDSNTYYPQAVARNTKTAAVIATINLVQDPNDNLRYTGSFMTPADSTGEGYFLDVIAIPYTDTDRTIPSMNYGAETTPYFVWQPPPYYGGGDVSIIDYDRVGTIIDERVGKIKMPKMPRFDFPSMPEAKDVDFKPVFLELGNIRADLSEAHKRISEIPKPEKPEKVDLTSVHTRVNGLEDKMHGLLENHSVSIKQMLEEHRASMAEMHKKGIKGLKEEMHEEMKSYSESGIPVVFRSQMDRGPQKTSMPKGQIFRHLLETKKP